MNLPQFSAEAALGPTEHVYRRNAVSGGSGCVLPMLDKQCGNCAEVGRFGGIRGVGRRSCCQRVWTWNPATKRLELSWSCWFESCTPERTSILSF